MGFLTKLFGTNMAKEIKRIDPIVRKIEALEEEYKGLTDAQLQAKTAEFKERYQKGERVVFSGSERFSTLKAFSALAMPRAVRVTARAFSLTT